MPDLARDGDQLDVIFALAGPSEAKEPELEAAGVAYRRPVGTDGTMLFTTLDYGEVTLGTARSLAFGLTGERTALSLGVSRSWDLVQFASVTATAEIAAREVQGTGFGVTTLDESLRFTRFSLLYERGVPLQFQHRYALAVTKGFSNFGASPAQNSLSSTRGGTSDFRASRSAQKPLFPCHANSWPMSA